MPNHSLRSAFLQPTPVLYFKPFLARSRALPPRPLAPCPIVRPARLPPSVTSATCSMTDTLTNSFAVPSWRKLSDSAIPQDYINGPNFTTPPRELQSFRLFNQKEADVRIVLYRDHASWCPYCHKVQMLLEAKRIPYLIKKINMSCYGSKPTEFLKKVPSGLLPVIEFDGKVITESMDIMFLIEENFQTPYRRMIPTEDNDMMQAFHRYLRLERVFIGAWLGSLRGPMAMLPRGLQPVYQTLDVIEKSLGEFAGPFFYPGDEPSFVDINFCKFARSPVFPTPPAVGSATPYSTLARF